ncbi:6-phosphogluconolactonase [Desulfocurvus sp. DL9XJH121]
MERLDFDDMEALSAHAAGLVRDVAREAAGARGAFTLALAGGSTPRRTYELLAEAEGVPWDKAHVFYSDERCVEPGHEHRNSRMAEEALLSRVAVPESGLHPVKVAGYQPGLDAGGYEFLVRNTFKFNGLGEGKDCPFDCILLGMGEDGHTASLFPDGDELTARRQIVMAVEPKGDPHVARVTMTLPLINQARNVIFLVAGAKKKALADRIFKDPEAAAARYPAAMVRPRGRLVWLVAG